MEVGNVVFKMFLLSLREAVICVKLFSSHVPLEQRGLKTWFKIMVLDKLRD